MKSLDQVIGLVLLFLVLLLQFSWIIPWLLSSGNLFGLLAAIDKWDGKLPVYMTGGAAVPFVPVK